MSVLQLGKLMPEVNLICPSFIINGKTCLLSRSHFIATCCWLQIPALVHLLSSLSLSMVVLPQNPLQPITGSNPLHPPCRGKDTGRPACRATIIITTLEALILNWWYTLNHPSTLCCTPSQQLHPHLRRLFPVTCPCCWVPMPKCKSRGSGKHEVSLKLSML